MFKTLRDAWSIPEIRKKLLYTLLMLLIFRLGSAVVVPFLDTSTVSTWMASNATGGNFLEYLDIITGGALSQATVFSLSITPYINASIIMQLLTYALPPLERMRDEGEEGQKKLNKITAAVSLALSVFMSFAYYLTLKNQMNAVVDGGSKAANVFTAFVIILSFIAGTSIVVWMGNQINDKGTETVSPCSCSPAFLQDSRLWQVLWENSPKTNPSATSSRAWASWYCSSQ